MTELSEGTKEWLANQKAAKETLARTLDDIHESAMDIDAQCRELVKDVMASLEQWEHDYAPEFLARIGKIWSAAHCIRRNVERDDEDEKENITTSDVQEKTAAESEAS